MHNQPRRERGFLLRALPMLFEPMILTKKPKRWNPAVRLFGIRISAWTAWDVAWFAKQALVGPHPNKQDWLTAQWVNERFSKKPGSKHIASTFALAHLARVLRTNEITSAFELGAGIGTMTYLLLSELPSSVRVECTEPNEFCVEQLHHNIPAEMLHRLLIHPNSDPRTKTTFDLVIIDGLVKPPFTFIRPGTICFVEGERGKARHIIQTDLASRGLVCKFRNYPRGVRLIRGTVHRALRTRKGCWIGIVEQI
jgi:hypothetical protein